MTKPSTTQNFPQDNASVKKTQVDPTVQDKREQARQQHSNHFTNRAPVDKSESSSDSK